MTDKDLRNLNRKELLELLVRQEKENLRLKNALNAADEEAENREISIQNAGSIAEASLLLTNVFEEAEKAANIYLENVKRSCADQNAAYDRIVSQARAEADRIIAEAEAQKRQILREADEYWSGVSQKMEQFYQAHAGLRDILSVNPRSRYDDSYEDDRAYAQPAFSEYSDRIPNASYTAKHSSVNRNPVSVKTENAGKKNKEVKNKEVQMRSSRRVQWDEETQEQPFTIDRYNTRGKVSPDDFDLGDDETFRETFTPQRNMQYRFR